MLFNGYEYHLGSFVGLWQPFRSVRIDPASPEAQRPQPFCDECSAAPADANWTKTICTHTNTDSSYIMLHIHIQLLTMLYHIKNTCIEIFGLDLVNAAAEICHQTNINKQQKIGNHWKHWRQNMSELSILCRLPSVPLEDRLLLQSGFHNPARVKVFKAH